MIKMSTVISVPFHFTGVLTPAPWLSSASFSFCVFIHASSIMWPEFLWNLNPL